LLESLKMNRVIYISLITIVLLTASNNASALNWIGAIAPELGIKDQDGKLTYMKDLKGQFTVLYFYPKDDTPGCTIEANKFKVDHAKYTALNTRIIGASLDSIESHQDFIDAHELPFTLLSDEDAVAAKRYQVLSNFGLMRFTKRQTFIIDPDGVIVKHYADVKPKLHSEQILADLPLLISNWSVTKKR
jgi:thioredoxin-dependent peroxiredoxin